MDEYIEREALLARMRNHYCDACDSYNGVRCRACPFGDAIDDVEDAPVANVAPVRHGRWILMGQKVYPSQLTHCCSLCGGHGNNGMDFCPNCGARMDGEEDEHGT